MINLYLYSLVGGFLLVTSNAFGACTKQEMANYFKQGLKSQEIQMICNAPNEENCCCSVRIEERSNDSVATTKGGGNVYNDKSWNMLSQDYVWIPQDQCTSNNIDFYSRERKQCASSQFCGKN